MQKSGIPRKIGAENGHNLSNSRLSSLKPPRESVGSRDSISSGNTTSTALTSNSIENYSTNQIEKSTAQKSSSQPKSSVQSSKSPPEKKKRISIESSAQSAGNSAPNSPATHVSASFSATSSFTTNITKSEQIITDDKKVESHFEQDLSADDISVGNNYPSNHNSSFSSGSSHFVQHPPAHPHHQNENIKVSVRVRPLVKEELIANESIAWGWEENTIYTLASQQPQQQGIGSKRGLTYNEQGQPVPVQFSFDHLFTPGCSNAQIFEEVVKGVVENAMRGFHGSVFCYGQTSTGKTYTMNGVISLAVAHCFEMINYFPEREFLLRFSYLEVR